MRARIHLPNGGEVVINARPEEIQRLSALKDHRVEILPDVDVMYPGAPWLFNDISKPRGKA
jgi:hypothetical protein